jgi:hypothetical protein
MDKYKNTNKLFCELPMLRGTLTPQPPLPKGERGSKTNFLFPLSPFGRGARGEGLGNFHVKSVSWYKLLVNNYRLFPDNENYTSFFTRDLMASIRRIDDYGTLGIFAIGIGLRTRQYKYMFVTRMGMMGNLGSSFIAQ